MKKLLLVALAVLALGSLTLWARPMFVKCPQDGENMMFDHQVGYLGDAVCWYSHYHNDITPDGKMVSVKHDFPIFCSHP